MKKTMNDTWVSVAIILVALVLVSLLLPNNRTKEAVAEAAVEAPEDQMEVLSYFIMEVRDDVREYANEDEVAFSGEADAFTLMKVYPGLEKYAFRNVITQQGEYSIQDDKLTFTGNGASDSDDIGRDGMRTLLQNIAFSHGISASSQRDVDAILRKIRVAPAQ